jgi:hypothetical protein
MSPPGGDGDGATRDSERWCPSARCAEGAVLLGVVGSDGKVGFVTPRIEIDRDFVTEAHKGRTPEKRFRFAQPCLRGGCTEWTGTRCGVIDRAIDAARRQGLSKDLADLPRCSIRSSCRWFAQIGADACTVCPLVITDLQADV